MEETDKKEQPPIIDQVKEYVETYLKLTRLKAIQKGSSIVASIAVDIVMILAALSVVLFASITLAFFLAEVFHSEWKGFGCVALGYALAVVLMITFKKNFERPIVNILIKKLFK
ncbi:hypothetical protein [Mucilaginibacter myungsuensis]|uniref:Uncharacterized protein n=1 Tax=Mucilaginibacter myungsuensis TaxID=649104 RepID=A0A929KXJ7_9SPHI|nr:hypothetical protein [Mucilaginibacter myungsuensis]MBE9663489.1 hypothetical protein [Mucilaginibacter myungsuensis]MDN3600227.1 hypothetical protein [Mucilaginibacter myungsuensis]